MKNLSLLLMVLVLVAFGSCKKDNQNQNTTAPKYVKAIAASYLVKEGDLQLKDMPVGVNRQFSLYVRNSSFYAPATLALCRGLEFITGSVAQVWWADHANNPNSFPVTTGIYANQTPDADVRQVVETKRADGKTAFLGMVDFHPAAPLFPLTINGYRLGDFLQINTDELTRLPGGENLSFQVVYTLQNVNLQATITKPVLTGALTAVPNGSQFCWNDIIYSEVNSTTETPVDFPNRVLGSADKGNQTVYDGVEAKVVDVNIIVTDHGTQGMPTRSITKHLTNLQLGGAGESTLMILKTDKIGWYDSATNTFTENDITVKTVNVVFD